MAPNMYPMGSYPELDAELRMHDAETVAATAVSDVIDLGENFSPAPLQPIGVVLDVTALDATTGNETYEVELQESYDNTNWSSTGLKFSITATGQVFKQIGVARRYQRLRLVLAGTSPSITLSSWLTPAK